MRASTTLALVMAFAASLVSAAPSRLDLAERNVTNLMERDTTLTVLSDNETATVVVAAASAQSVEGGAAIGDAVINIIDAVFSIIDGISGDIEKRKKSTQEVAARTRASFPNDNVFVSNVGYTWTGTVVGKTSTSYNARIGSDVTFDVLVTSGAGVFTLNGDGGFQNWAYLVSATQCTRVGKVVTCI